MIVFRVVISGWDVNRKSIALIQPPVEDFYYTSVRRQPLGLLYIASVLGEYYDVELLNAHSAKSLPLDVPQQFDYLEEFIHSSDPMSRFPFHSYRRYGKSYEWFRERIMHSTAFVFMLSIMFTPYHEEAKRLIALIRELKPKSIIVAGGAHATLYPEDTLRCGVDFVICGEGDLSALMLVRALETGAPMECIPGLAYIHDGLVVTTKPSQMSSIDELYPDRSYLQRGDTKFKNRDIISFLTSRGCTNACTFCSGRILWKGRRARSIASVEKELMRICREFRHPIINFEDENIFFDYASSLELLVLLERFHRDYDCEYTAWNGISIENVDEMIIEKMNNAGFNEINLSLVSHSPKLLKQNRRPFNSEKFMAIAAKARSLSMTVRAYFILGLPGQDETSIEQTINCLEKSGADYFPSVFYNVFDIPQNWKMQRSSAFFNQTAVSRRTLLYYFNLCMNRRENNYRESLKTNLRN